MKFESVFRDFTEKNRIEWYHWLYLWLFPTNIFIEDEKVALFYKMVKGTIYIMRVTIIHKREQ